jgi:hypothetical protein
MTQRAIDMSNQKGENNMAGMKGNEYWESTVEEPTRSIKKPGDPMWGMPAGTLGSGVEVISFGDPVAQPGQYDSTGMEKQAVPAETSLFPRPPLTAFEQELRRLINKFSMENHSNTPDNILAEYLCSCLDSFDRATMQRERWYGRRTF